MELRAKKYDVVAMAVLLKFRVSLNAAFRIILRGLIDC